MLLLDSQLYVALIEKDFFWYKQEVPWAEEEFLV